MLTQGERHRPGRGLQLHLEHPTREDREDLPLLAVANQPTEETAQIDHAVALNHHDSIIAGRNPELLEATGRAGVGLKLERLAVEALDRDTRTRVKLAFSLDDATYTTCLGEHERRGLVRLVLEDLESKLAIGREERVFRLDPPIALAKTGDFVDTLLIRDTDDPLCVRLDDGTDEDVFGLREVHVAPAESHPRATDPCPRLP